MRAVPSPLLLLLLLPLTVSGCAVEFLSTTPTSPGAPTAPAEVVALAGPDLVVLEGSRVVLAGGSSRALVGEPELAWSQREGPLATLSNPSAAAPAFVAPLGPARLVFSLEVTADDVRDVDEVVIDVVTTATDLPAAPRVLALPADRSVAVDAPVVLETPWTGAGVPVVSARCATVGEPVARIDGATLVVELTPRGLPCPVVLEDVVEATGPAVPAAGRAALTLWPIDVVVANATRARAPATVEAGAPVVIDLDPGASIAVVDGTTVTLERSGERVSFVAPRRPGRLTLVAETRVGGSSGGARVIALEVGAGTGNVAPTVEGGLDLRVRPGASFRIAPRAADGNADDSVDEDVTLDVRQVLGEPARQAGGGVGVLVAPDQAQTLLFHVVASDGRSESSIDPVRVVVDPAAENQPPLLILPPEFYVTPGSTFVIDGSGASDPDAGLITSWRIAQSQADDVILLGEPVEEPAVTLTAGAAGERYQFLVSVADDGGLEASASVLVIVEEAGPYVDPDRATGAGNGTISRPFASISDAVLTAARHRLPALHLAAAAAALPLGALPDGLGLEGGWRYDVASGAYVQDAPSSSVRLAGGELRLAGGAFSRLAVTADDDVTLRLQRGIGLSDFTVADQVTVAIDVGARVVIRASILGAVENAGSLELDDVEIRGPLTADNAVTDIGADATVIVDVSDAAGVGDTAVDIVGGVLRVEVGARLVGRRTGVRIGPGAVAAIAGDIDVDGGNGAGEGREIGLLVDGGTVELAGATVRVAGTSAVGIAHASGSVGGRATLIVRGDSAVGVDASAAFGADLGGTWQIQGTTLGVGARGPDVSLEQARVTVEADDASGVRADTVTLAACLIETSGVGVDVGVVAGRGTLRHATLRGSDRCLEGVDAVRLVNSLCLSPGGFAGTVTFGVVGVVDSIDLASLACSTCIAGPAAAVDATGALVDDSVVGGPNPFVDVGDPALAVAADLLGQPVPRGPGPDLGALERAAPEAQP